MAPGSRPSRQPRFSCLKSVQSGPFSISLRFSDNGILGSTLEDPTLNQSHGGEPMTVGQSGSWEAMLPNPPGNAPPRPTEHPADVVQAQNHAAVKSRISGEGLVARPWHSGGIIRNIFLFCKLAGWSAGESADPAWAVTLSGIDRFCYHLRRLGGAIWEISVQMPGPKFVLPV